jgi:hypothetical protein
MARLDRYRPSLASGFLGPMNGQEVRRGVVEEVFRTVPFDAVVETGTYRGTTAEYLRGLTDAPIVTIEADLRRVYYARRRLRHLPRIRVVHGDSAAEIRRLAFRPAPVGRTPFFYLDAHRARELPVRWELLEVVCSWQRFCVLLDDIAVPGDPGYRFDDHGPGFRLTEGMLDGLPLAAVAWFWPAVPAAQETGHRRGWLLLARGEDIIASLERIPGLRRDAGRPG